MSLKRINKKFPSIKPQSPIIPHNSQASTDKQIQLQDFQQSSSQNTFSHNDVLSGDSKRRIELKAKLQKRNSNTSDKGLSSKLVNQDYCYQQNQHVETLQKTRQKMEYLWETSPKVGDKINSILLDHSHINILLIKQIIWRDINFVFYEACKKSTQKSKENKANNPNIGLTGKGMSYLQLLEEAIIHRIQKNIQKQLLKDRCCRNQQKISKMFDQRLKQLQTFKMLR